MGGLGFGGGDECGGFCAADIFEAVVRAHGNGMFTIVFCRRGPEKGHCELVVLLTRVTYISNGSDKNPVAAIDTVLSAFDIA